MYIKMRNLATLLLLSCMCLAYAQKAENISYLKGNVTAEDKSGEAWWGYYDGNKSSVKRVGVEVPITYHCAIKIPAGHKDLLGKQIKAISFILFSTDNIENVNIWMSNILPIKAEKADICYESVPKSSLVAFNDGKKVNEVSFKKPYLVTNKDVFVGYTFTVKRCVTDYDKNPIAITDKKQYDDSFWLNWTMGWSDFSAQQFGNAAIRVLVDSNVAPIKGDANYDGNVDISDVSGIVKYIIDKDVNPFNVKAADIDNNGEINVVDAASAVEIILERYKAPEDKQSSLSNDKIIANKTNTGVDIYLSGNESYKAFQMDLVVPEGKEISDVIPSELLYKTHSVEYKKIDDERYRVVVFSLGGEDFNASSSKLLSIDTDDSDVKVENIVFATSDLRAKSFSNINTSEVTGIENAEAENVSEAIYTIEGVKVNKAVNNLDKGVYVVNGKKIIVK